MSSGEKRGNTRARSLAWPGLAGQAARVHDSAPAIGRAGLRNLCLRRPAPGEGGNKVFGKRFARLLPVRPRQLVFLFARVLRAFVDARNRE
uniref:Uncharacterized protein n=1 Tax=Oryza sativa subsp. japonica TaxID=39947 RepID=Q6K418_ORYSJ|nr:hypothetical protein [Oryza sativa Japonica Group]